MPSSREEKKICHYRPYPTVAITAARSILFDCVDALYLNVMKMHHLSHSIECYDWEAETMPGATRGSQFGVSTVVPYPRTVQVKIASTVCFTTLRFSDKWTAKSWSERNLGSCCATPSRSWKWFLSAFLCSWAALPVSSNNVSKGRNKLMEELDDLVKKLTRNEYKWTDSAVVEGDKKRVPRRS